MASGSHKKPTAAKSTAGFEVSKHKLYYMEFVVWYMSCLTCWWILSYYNYICWFITFPLLKWLPLAVYLPSGSTGSKFTKPSNGGMCGIYKFVSPSEALSTFYRCHKVVTQGHIKPGLAVTSITMNSCRTCQEAKGKISAVLNSQNKSSFPVAIPCV